MDNNKDKKVNNRMDKNKARKYKTNNKMGVSAESRQKERNKTNNKTNNKANNKINNKTNNKTNNKVSNKADTGFRLNDKQNGIVCKYNRKCGGCIYQGLAYEKQLEEKEKKVNKLLKGYVKPEKIIGMENPYHYRNKVHAVFDREKNGTIISGTYEPKSHRVVNVDTCLIDNVLADKIIYDIRNLLKSFKIKTYDEVTGYGLLRHVLVRTADATGEVMVVLVLGSPILPSKNNFVKAIRKLHPEISTVIINVNDKHTSMILGDRELVIYGKGYIVDELCGMKFRISSKSFYQVNRVQTEKLYSLAIDMANLIGNEKVVDAYSGIGTIGMIASSKAKEVLSVELNRDAVKDAKVNAKINEISNIRFVNADAGEFMIEMAENNETADVVFMDPPRSGSSDEFINSLLKLKPEKIVYISCNPETLARDLKKIAGNVYQVKKIQPVEMFAWTEHVETVVLLSKKNG